MTSSERHPTGSILFFINSEWKVCGFAKNGYFLVEIQKHYHCPAELLCGTAILTPFSFTSKMIEIIWERFSPLKPTV